ncbi:MAG: hypothetical protein AUK34_06620 [Ignavibacteria bacterium CG2_30_36_16]|nr:polysaccharide deacetylase family protein [Ignavibacteria bacterium]OIP60323.1 MAG: hypothetical protein AUK34_06620 [Ignavibacteria bacterium CG2_30_36_16]
MHRIPILLLLFVSSFKQIPSQELGDFSLNYTYYKGAIIRMDSTQKNIYLFFTGHEFADGYKTLMDIFNKHKIKGNFFFTGDFYRNQNFAGIINELKNEGHYLGAHSDKHLLYAPWDNRDSTLVSFEQFSRDVFNNYAEMKKFDITKDDAPFFLPPFEWFNDTISKWTKQLGLHLTNFTPGTSANQDWSIPELGKGYYSSDTIFARILKFEQLNKDGLNGFLLLTHIGTDPRRTDKFYNRLDELITELKRRGYSFKRLMIEN